MGEPLLVTGSFLVENLANGTTGLVLRVLCEVRVAQRGDPVIDAVVAVNPAPPGFQTVLVGATDDPGQYRGSYMGYAETARLTITKGSTNTGAMLVQGPTLHVIEQPTADQVVPAGQALELSWSQPGGAADSVDVGLASGFSALALPDTGAYEVPSRSAGADTVSVTRWNENTLPAAAGSELQFGVRSTQSFQAE